jgi:hypothetical protein
MLGDDNGAGTMTHDRPAVRRSLTSRFGAWLKSFTGILSSLAALVTAVATLVAAYQTSRVHAQSRTIAEQSRQLRQFTARPTPAGGGSAPPASSASSVTGGSAPSQQGYLSALQPTVANAYLSTGPQTISSKAYQNSVTFSCNGTYGNDQPDAAYDVAGSQVFTALVGIPDNTTDVTGVTETVTFANQDGAQLAKPVVVSLGSPARVQLNVSNVTQLEVTCTGIDEHTRQPNSGHPVSLGNAAIS